MDGSKRGSKPGTRPTDDSENDLAARIGASLSSARPARPIQARPVGKPINHLARPQTASDELDDGQLPDALSEGIEPLAQRDLFLPILGILAVVALTGSFLVFLMITRVPEVREMPQARVTASPSAEIDLSHQGTLTVGDGQLPEPSPSATPTAVPSAQVALPIETAPVESALPPPPLPVATLPPAGPSVRVTPPPVRPVTPPRLNAATPKPAPPVETSDFVVLAGPYESRSDAEAGSGALGDLGQAVKINEDKGKFWLQLGNPFSLQDEALVLAEQVVQRGHQVIVKKK